MRPSRTNANPMTYRTRSGRQFVVIATGSGENGKLMTFALPERTTQDKETAR